MKTKTPRVLYVDDEVLCGKSLIRCLKQKKTIVDVAQNLEESLELSKKHTYTVILTDYSIPGSNGIEVIEQLLPLQPNAVYLLTSGNPYVELPENNEASSRIFDIIAKPWGFKEISQTIDQAIEYFEQINIIPTNQDSHKDDFFSLLLVEDDLSDQYITTDNFSKIAQSKFKTESVRRISDAIFKLKEKNFDAVLVDLSLADARGISAIREIKLLAGDARILVIGGTEDEFLIHQALRAGASGFLTKDKLSEPLLSSTLLMLIEAHGAHVVHALVANFN